MFDSGYILLVLLVAILFYMWRNAGRFSLSSMLKKDHQDHIHAGKVIARIPDGATWSEYRRLAVEEENKGEK